MRRVVTEEQILDAGLALLDTGGREAASVRRIAAAVGVAPSVVYTYFPDSAAVREAVLGRVLGEVLAGGPEPGAGCRRTVLEEVLLGLRGRLLAHPGVVPILLGRGGPGTWADRLTDHVGQLFTAAGLKPEAGARAAYVVLAFVFGAVAREIGGEPGEDRFCWGLRRVLDGLAEADER